MKWLPLTGCSNFHMHLSRKRNFINGAAHRNIFDAKIYLAGL